MADEELTQAEQSASPARLVHGEWYVPVGDLQEALDALERYYRNLPGSTLAVSDVLGKHGRIRRRS